jgi:hypothetical protein
MSYSFWLKTTDTNGDIYRKTDASGDLGMYIKVSTGQKIAATLRNSGGSVVASATSTNAVNTGIWYYITVVIDRGTNFLTVYTNGVAGTPVDISGFSAIDLNSSIAGYHRFGGGVADSPLLGEIDDFRIYNKVLGASDIASLYTSSKPTNCDQSCVAWWKFDETSGTSATDSTGNGRTGTLSGFAMDTTSGWNEGVFGNGLMFDGVNDTISISDNDALDIGTGSKSWVFWFKTTTSGVTNNIYRKSGSTNVGGLIISVSSANKLRVDMRNSDGTAAFNASSANSVNDGEWHQGAIVLDRTGLIVYVYVDGLQGGSVSVSGIDSPDPNLNVTNAALIGQSSSAYYTGSLDNFRIYSRALQASEIYDMYMTSR